MTAAAALTAGPSAMFVDRMRIHRRHRTSSGRSFPRDDMRVPASGLSAVQSEFAGVGSPMSCAARIAPRTLRRVS
jgi:hypothetical protein